MPGIARPLKHESRLGMSQGGRDTRQLGADHIAHFLPFPSPFDEASFAAGLSAFTGFVSLAGSDLAVDLVPALFLGGSFAEGSFAGPFPSLP